MLPTVTLTAVPLKLPASASDASVRAVPSSLIDPGLNVVPLGIGSLIFTLATLPLPEAVAASV